MAKGGSGRWRGWRGLENEDKAKKRWGCWRQGCKIEIKGVEGKTELEFSIVKVM